MPEGAGSSAYKRIVHVMGRALCCASRGRQLWKKAFVWEQLSGPFRMLRRGLLLSVVLLA